MTEPLFVAEIKPCDPFTDPDYQNIRSPGKLAELACEYGDIVGVHTHPAWLGGFDWLRQVRAMTDKPILAKGAHVFGFEVTACLDAGADFVLTVNPELRMMREHNQLWFEAAEALFAWGDEPATVVVNARSLMDGSEHKYARAMLDRALRANQPPSGRKKNRMVQASFIRKPGDVVDGVYAYIVGTHLEEFVAAKTAMDDGVVM